MKDCPSPSVTSTSPDGVMVPPSPAVAVMTNVSGSGSGVSPLRPSVAALSASLTRATSSFSANGLSSWARASMRAAQNADSASPVLATVMPFSAASASAASTCSARASLSTGSMTLNSWMK